jgi:transcriptional regulator GlxA family with amidase domain
LKVAVMLLSSEEVAIAEVARRCGYSSAEALAHALTTEGLPPPNELRRRIVGNVG